MKFIPKPISILLSAYVLGIVFFTIFRIILLVTETHQYSLITENQVSVTLLAFLMGLRFDTVISTYFLLIPFLLLTISSLLNFKKKWFSKLVTICITTLYIFGFLICSIDIPYFNYSFARVTAVIFNWADDANTVIQMVVQEWTYLIFGIVFFVLSFAYVLVFNKIQARISIFYSNRKIEQNKKYFVNQSLWFLAVLIALFLGMRGRIDSPIKINTSCISNYAFINQLGLNPVFTLVKSFVKRVNILDEKLAIENAKRFLKVSSENNFVSPIARMIKPDTTALNVNIIVVIMESMSAKNMSRYGNSDNLTPTLDSMSKISYCFENTYSAGKHTSNGIYSTLYSFPAIWSERPTGSVLRNKFSGFPITLKNRGYQTIYFTTHTENFDNIGEFLPHNGFDRLVSQKDYPPEKVVGTFGVPDHVMFERSIQEINELYNNKKPFFAALMTTSNHGPYILPKDISLKPHTQTIEKQMVEYSDWAIGQWLQEAAKQVWFENTIFVFTGDHGAMVGNNLYDIPLSYFHVPFIVYSPKILGQPKSISQIGGQIDIFPTLMGMMKIPYINNTLGIDLQSDTRPFTYFSADTRIGCVNHEFLYIYNQDGSESLFRYSASDLQNTINQNRALADSMKIYTFSMLQTSQWLLEHQQTEAK